VLNRGTERRSIFYSRRCYERFIELLSILPQRFGVRLHGYALMGNHYHLQLESREANLSQAVQWLNVSYSVWLNREYRRIGPLFQAVSKAILHEPSEALVINRYIHLNPVRVKGLRGHETRDVGDTQIGVCIDATPFPLIFKGGRKRVATPASGAGRIFGICPEVAITMTPTKTSVRPSVARAASTAPTRNSDISATRNVAMIRTKSDLETDHLRASSRSSSSPCGSPA
jgi:REP element-mobilizing transposase RayT